MKAITSESYPFALAKKLPWMLFCRGGQYIAHRRPNLAKKVDAATVPFSMEIAEIPPATRNFFRDVIADMKALS